jgi:hypothetical protein
MTYDLWGKYAIDKMKIGQNCRRFANQNNQVELPLVIEFKYRGEDILIDFESDRKYFTDIDMIVCWDFDEVAFSKQRVTTEILPKEEVLFFGSNYRFVWPGAYNLGSASDKPVLVLRRFLEDLQRT